MKSKTSLIYGICSLVVVLLSFAFALLDAIIPLDIWVHPILNFLFGIFFGFGVMAFIMAILKKSAWFFFVSSILLGLAAIYVLIGFSVVWWACIISVIVLLAVFAILSVMIAGNMTESVALNNSPDYKTFEQRKAEEKEEKEEKPLPELKSFK